MSVADIVALSGLAIAIIGGILQFGQMTNQLRVLTKVVEGLRDDFDERLNRAADKQDDDLRQLRSEIAEVRSYVLSKNSGER